MMRMLENKVWAQRSAANPRALRSSLILRPCLSSALP